MDFAFNFWWNVTMCVAISFSSLLVSDLTSFIILLNADNVQYIGKLNKKAHGLNDQPLKDFILGSSPNVNRKLLTHIITNVHTHPPTYGWAQLKRNLKSRRLVNCNNTFFCRGQWELLVQINLIPDRGHQSSQKIIIIKTYPSFINLNERNYLFINKDIILVINEYIIY